MSCRADRRRVDLAASLVGSPAVLFLDEPTTGLDPTARAGLWDVVGELTATGTTVVLTTQYLEEADRLADDIVVLDHGRVAARGTPAELKRLVGGKVVTATIRPGARPASPPSRHAPAGRPRSPSLQRRSPTPTPPPTSSPTSPPPASTSPTSRSPRPASTTSSPTSPRPEPDHDRHRSRARASGRSPGPARRLVARNLRTTARVPQLLMFSLTMPMAMLVLFSQVFRSVADSPTSPVGVSYIDFLTPAMLAVTTVMAGTNAGVAAAIDHTNGLHDRFATLPDAAGLPGMARTINETVFTPRPWPPSSSAAAIVLGFRFHGTAVDAAAGLLVLGPLAAR